MVLQSIVGLFCNKTYSAMTDYDDEDDEGYHVGNKDGNDNDNAASISGSYGPIFDLITAPWYHGG